MKLEEHKFILGLSYLVDMFDLPNTFNTSLQSNIYVYILSDIIFKLCIYEQINICLN